MSFIFFIFLVVAFVFGSKIIANEKNVGKKIKEILAIVDGKNLKLLNL